MSCLENFRDKPDSGTYEKLHVVQQRMVTFWCLGTITPRILGVMEDQRLQLAGQQVELEGLPPFYTWMAVSI